MRLGMGAIYNVEIIMMFHCQMLNAICKNGKLSSQETSCQYMLRAKSCLKLVIVQFDYEMLKDMECLKLRKCLKLEKCLKLRKMLEAMKMLEAKEFC